MEINVMPIGLLVLASLFLAACASSSVERIGTASYSPQQPNAEVFVFTDASQVKELYEVVGIISDLITGYHVDDWDNTTLNYVEKAFGPNHRNLQAFQNATATAGNYSWSQEQWSTQYAKDLHGKTTLLEGFIGQLQKEIHLRRLVTPTAPNINPISSRSVFIVHGHDGELKHASARLVTNLGLEPVILHEQANKGRTIIEKFTDHAHVGFAIVLLSADDEGDQEIRHPLIRSFGQDRTLSLRWGSSSAGSVASEFA